MSNGWSTQRVSDGEAAARAGGRRKYNALRRDRAEFRRIEVADRLVTYGWTYGVQARIAEELGVSDATISRDLKAIFPGAIECPACTVRHPMERWKELERQGRVTLGPLPSEDEQDAPGADEDGELEGDAPGGDRWTELVDEVIPVDPHPGPESSDDRLRRTMALTDEMTVENAAGIALDDVVGAVNNPADPDATPEAWPPAALDDNRFNVVDGHGLANAQP